MDRGTMDRVEKQARRLGGRCSALFQCFIDWIVEDCIKNNLTQIYFLAREGEFFEQVFLASGHDAPKRLQHRLLSVSRLSTFLPSLHSFDMADWGRFLSQYRDQRVSAFARSLGTPYEATMDLLLRHGLQEEESLGRQEAQFQKSVASDEFQRFIRLESAQAKERLIEYLKQCGLSGDASRVAIVDIGWRGTIQDNLCYVLPRTQIYGYYLGLIAFLNGQPENAVKKGFLNSLPMSDALLKSLTQLEMICGSKRGSTVGYEACADGRVRPVFEDNAQDLYSWKSYTEYFQAGVIASCPISGAQRGGLMQRVLPLTLFPDLGMAKAFFRFRYSERFGLGVHVDQAELSLSWGTMLRLLLRGNRLTELRQFLNSTKWPQGFLRIHHLSGLLPLYNAILIFVSRGKGNRF